MSATKHIPTTDQIKNLPHLNDCTAAIKQARAEERERVMAIFAFLDSEFSSYEQKWLDAKYHIERGDHLTTEE